MVHVRAVREPPLRSGVKFCVPGCFVKAKQNAGASELAPTTGVGAKHKTPRKTGG